MQGNPHSQLRNSTFNLDAPPHVTGQIPRALGQMTSLLGFDLSGNKLSGSIPWFLFQNLKNVREILLDDNQLTGTIPSQLSRASSLEGMTHNRWYSDACVCIYMYMNALTNVSGSESKAYYSPGIKVGRFTVEYRHFDYDSAMWAMVKLQNNSNADLLSRVAMSESPDLIFLSILP